ncbi:MAG: MGMT family protein, partial [Clostridium sp.]|nr:MGMT family protein [Clostridium sp.]
MRKEYKAYYKSEIGIVEITSSEDAVLSIYFVDKEGETVEMPKILKEAYNQIDEYFKGKRKKFNLKLSFEGTDFQNRVWNELTKIPYGQVVSYKDIAI